MKFRSLAPLVVALALFQPAKLAAETFLCFELRTYTANEGKLDALHSRFRDHTMAIFENHGMTNVGYWVPQENDRNELIYLLAYPSREAREKAWNGFFSDPAWTAAYKASVANGRLVKKVTSVFLKPTDYSPALKTGVSPEPRAFELRTYTATPGNLGNLNARFRNHTVELFEKHGMTNFAYFNLMEDQDGADTTLVYLLAHASKAAAKASFDSFRQDPKWKAARKESEKVGGGSLTAKGGVKSVFLNPTDYSPTK